MTARGTSRGPQLALYLPNLEGGGAERMMLSLAKGFADRGHLVDFVLASAYGSYLGELPANVRLVDLNSRSVTASLPGLVRYLRSRRPAAVLASLPHASVMLVWAKILSRASSRIFIREATTPSAVTPEDRDGGIKQKLLPLAMRLFYPLSDGVVAVSTGVADDLSRSLGVPLGKITTIYNPVVTAELHRQAREPLQDPWFPDDDVPVVLSVGRLRVEKDFATLLRAFQQVRMRREARLLILGDGEERPNLERLVADLGLEDHVRMPGFVANPFPYMARASLYVLSSRREGLPGALIQAMACGCPVVSTDCPSGPAEVLVNGRFGALVPVGDAVAMAQAMLSSLEDPTGAAELRRRANDFDEAESIDNYLELMLAGTRSPARGELA